MASRYATARPARDEKPTIPYPPQTCGCFGCKNDTNVTMTVCRIGDSGPIVGSLRLPTDKNPLPATFSRRTKRGSWADTTDFQFIRWIARCCDCYVREQHLRDVAACTYAVAMEAAA